VNISEAHDCALGVSAHYQSLAEELAPTVVSIKTYGRFRRGRMGMVQQGSGVVVSTDGLIVTNNHVVNGAEKLGVVLAGGREYEAELVGRDGETDLALLRIDAEGLRAASLAREDELAVGEWVVALGNPYGLGQTMTTGIVSGLGRRGLSIATYEDFIQTDAAINPGNSGGPLLDLEGRVVGINTAVAMAADVSNGLGFAIPVRMVRDVVESLKREGKVVRGFIGIQPETMDDRLVREAGYPVGSRVRIGRVVDDSPANAAGLRVGDVVLTIGGKPIRAEQQLFESIAALAPGERVMIGVWRDGDELELPVRVSDRARQFVAAE
jgi:S1-C subfamily serine protease